MTEHFDGVQTHDDRSPEGFVEVPGIEAVLINPADGRLVLTGAPDSEGSHNCDERGCGTMNHKIAEFDVSSELFHG